MIPLTIPALGAEEISACERVLKSGMLVQGKEVQAFEALLAKATGRTYAVAVSNGTSALELALRALELGPGDEVLCPALTWPSPAHAIRSVGASVGLVEVDPHEWNATEVQFAAARTPRTRAAIVIEQFGNPARHEAIARALPDIPLIVDAACSLGASYRDAPCGSHGLIACTSFHPRKVLTTGEGGACMTNDAGLAQRLRVLRNHGQLEPGNFVAAAGNERMTELAAAIGQVQLGKLERLCAERRALADRLLRALPGLITQRGPEHGRANRQTMGVLVGPPFAGSEARERAIVELASRGVQAGKLSYALHTLPQFAREAEETAQAGRALAVSEDIAARGMCVPLFPGMRPEQLDQVISALQEVLG